MITRGYSIKAYTCVDSLLLHITIGAGGLSTSFVPKRPFTFFEHISGKTCREKNGGCSYKCTDQLWGAMCSCPSGMKLSANGAKCEGGLLTFLFFFDGHL